jgi:hypothetical protein
MARAMPVIKHPRSEAQELRLQLAMNPDLPPTLEERLRDLLAEHLPLPLAHQLFPRGPEANELQDQESDFVRECNRYVEAARHMPILTDLTDQVWP